MKNLKSILHSVIIFIILNFSNNLFSQISKWEVFLNADNIECITQENDSILWIGTYNAGLVRYNRINNTSTLYHVKNSKLPSLHVYTIEIDHAGNRWIGTHYGLVKINTEGIWEVYNPVNSILPDEIIKDIFTNENGIWIACFNGIVHIDTDENWHLIDSGTEDDSPNNNRAIYVDTDSIIWVGYGRPFLDYGGLAKLENNSWKHYNKTEGNFTGTYVYDICADSDDNLWLATYTDGIFKMESENFTQFDTSNTIFQHDCFTTITCDPVSGNIYAGSGDANQYIPRTGYYEYSDSSWKVVHNSNNTSFGSVYDILPLENGQIYIGTNLGLKIWNETNYKKISVSESFLPSNDIISLFSQNDSLWIGTSLGLCLKTKDTVIVYDTNNSILNKDWIEFITADNKGRIFTRVGSYDTYVFANGLWNETEFGCIQKPAFNSENTMFYTSGYHDALYEFSETVDTFFYALDDEEYDHISNPVVDSLDNIYSYCSYIDDYTMDGLSIYNDGEWTIFNSQNSNIETSIEVINMAIDYTGIIWLCDLNFGLTSFDGENFNLYNTDNSSIPTNSILNVYVDQENNIWLGSFDGLIYYDRTDFSLIARENSGLIANYINAITKTDDGTIWVATSSGLCSYSGDINNIITSVYEYNASHNNISYTVYPNPVTDVLSIEKINAQNSEYEVKLYDINGRIIIQRQHINESFINLNTECLNSGVYILNIISDNTENEFYKIIKQ